MNWRLNFIKLLTCTVITKKMAISLVHLFLVSNGFVDCGSVLMYIFANRCRFFDKSARSLIIRALDCII